MPHSLCEVLQDFHDRIKETILTRPEMTYRQIAARFGVSAVTVKRIARKAGLRRPRGARSKRNSILHPPKPSQTNQEQTNG